MDEKSQDSLNRILKKLEEMDQQIKTVGDRVARLEAEQPEETVKPTASLSPPSETQLPPQPSTSQPRAEAAPPAVEVAKASETGTTPPITEPQSSKATTSRETAPLSSPSPAAASIPPPLPTPPPIQQKPPASPGANYGNRAPVYPSRAPGAVPRPASKSKPPGGESLEMAIAGTWLPRIGVVVLALVLILFAREHVQGPLGKIIGIYLLSLGMIVFGLLFTKKYPRWASPVLAGGLAFSYFATYSMGFVEPMRLLDSLGVKLALLAVNLAVIFGFAQWRKSEVMAGTALVLGYMTTGVVGQDMAALTSCVALSIIAVLFLWINRWIVSTAVAAAFSYLTWVYVHAAVPGLERSAGESFWFHFTFLSLLFVVFTAASKVGAGVVLSAKSGNGSDSPTPAPQQSNRMERILIAMSQTNVAAYIGAVIWLLYATEIYWDRAWLFFLPMTAVLAALAFTFRTIRALAGVYVGASAVCLAFGIMSAASPQWMPIFLTLQGLVMLLAARGKPLATVWSALSAVLILYAGSYILTSGGTRVFNYGQTELVRFPGWTHMIVAGMTLAYTILWKQMVADATLRFSLSRFLTYTISLMAGIIWAWGEGAFLEEWKPVYIGLAVPLCAAAAAWMRSSAPLAALLAVAILSIISLMDNNMIVGGALFAGANWLLLGSAVAGGLWLERTGQFSTSPRTRLMWQTVYVWTQIFAINVIEQQGHPSYALLSVSILIAATVAGGWAVRSAAIAKSVVFPLFILFAFFGETMTEQAPWTIVASLLLLVAAAVPQGLPQWRARTGDRAPAYAGWYQGLILVQAGFVCLYGFTVNPFHFDPILTASVWALVTAGFAVAGAFSAGIYVTVWYALVAALFLWAGFLSEFAPTTVNRSGQVQSVQPIWSLAGIALLVASERLIRLGKQFVDERPPHPYIKWPREQSLHWVTVWMAVGTLVMTIIALRMIPELRLFYFTGAMVAAAFIWIVLGFWFSESIYRRSGLFLLCFGLLKGLVWDVLSLKNTVYRQISWTILGVLAIGASFLYNRFRSKVDNGGEVGTRKGNTNPPSPPPQ